MDYFAIEKFLREGFEKFGIWVTTPDGIQNYNVKDIGEDFLNHENKEFRKMQDFAKYSKLYGIV